MEDDPLLGNEVKATSTCRSVGEPRNPIFDGDYSFNTGLKHKLGLLDYICLIGMLSVSSFIGVFVMWVSRKKFGIDDFLMAGRNVGALPAGLSLVASIMSAITVMGLPMEVYMYSTMYVWIGLAYLFVCIVTAGVYLPLLYQLRISSIYQYLGSRFSSNVRSFAVIFFIFQKVIYIAIVLLAPSLAVNAVTGLHLWVSIISVGTVCTLYTSLGGIKAVIWADTFQCILMIIGLLVVAIAASVTVGSWGDVLESARRTGRIDLTDFRLQPTVRHSVWSLVIGGFFTWLALYASDQAQLHRCLVCNTMKQAKRAVWINFACLIIILFFGIYIGLYMSAFYENCDPLEAKLIKGTKQILPLFAMDIMKDVPGLGGIFLASLFGGALSSASSGLNAIATVVLEDCLRVFAKAPIRESRARLHMQTTSVIFGIVCIILTDFMSKLDDILETAVSFNGALASPLLGVFSLGMFFPIANEKGAMCGLLTSFIFNLYIIFRKKFVTLIPQSKAKVCISNCNDTALFNAGGDRLSPTTASPQNIKMDVNVFLSVSYLWFPCIAVVICILIGVIVSWCTGFPNTTDIDPRHIVPVGDEIFPFYFLPETTRDRMRYGIDHTDKWSRKSMKRFISKRKSTFLICQDFRRSTMVSTMRSTVQFYPESVRNLFQKVSSKMESAV